MADSPVQFQSGVDSLTIEFTNATLGADGALQYNVEADLSGDPTADYQLLRGIMDGDTSILSSPAFSGLEPDEIDTLQANLTALAVADQDMVANQLTRWIVDPLYQNNFMAGIGGPSFHEGDFDPTSLNRDIGADYITAIQRAVTDIHENGVSQEEALAALATESEAILNSVSSQVAMQMEQVRTFAADNDVIATIVEAGTEITGANAIEATLENDPKAFYEMFRNLEDTDLAGSPVYMALNAEQQDTLQEGLVHASNLDHRHVSQTIFNFIQSPNSARHYIDGNHENTFQSGNFDPASVNRDIGSEYIDLIVETVERYQDVDYDPAIMAEINAEFTQRADAIHQGQTDMINARFDALEVQDQAHDVVTQSIPAP